MAKTNTDIFFMLIVFTSAPFAMSNSTKLIYPKN